jgi:hypothetical protein
MELQLRSKLVTTTVLSRQELQTHGGQWILDKNQQLDVFELQAEEMAFLNN